MSLRDSETLASAVEDWSQLEVERELLRLSGEASRVRVKLRRAALHLGHAKARYKATSARVALRFRAEDISEGRPSRGVESITESIREARVHDDEDVKDAALAYYTAEAVLDAVTESGRLLRAQMSALQSVLADLRPMVSER